MMQTRFFSLFDKFGNREVQVIFYDDRVVVDVQGRSAVSLIRLDPIQAKKLANAILERYEETYECTKR